MSFSQLKKNRGKQLENLADAVKKIADGKDRSFTDDRIWKPTYDKAGNAEAIIRLLPPTNPDQSPWVRVWSHHFQAKGGWYIEKSLTTLDQTDPMGEYNSMLFNSGVKANENQARRQKRNLKYYSNILVIEDPGNPENEGKVMLFEYGKLVFDRINDAMNPKFKTEKKLNPFDFWDGANFILRIYKEERTIGDRKVMVPQWDRCTFGEVGPLFDTDNELEAVWKQQYDLDVEFLDPKHFKTYDELKLRMNKVLGLDGSGAINLNHSSVGDVAPATDSRSTPAGHAAETTPPWDESADNSSQDDLSSGNDDEVSAFFNKFGS